MVQFAVKWFAARAAGEDFYHSYVDRRISGFFSHWMTFSEVAMILLLLLASYLLFSASARRGGKLVWTICALALALSLALSYTRSVWLGMLAGGAYLLWHRSRKLVLLIPAAALAAILLAPGAASRRISSIADPNANSARLIMWRTGWRMIQAHPFLGLGPMRVGAHFREYLPPGVGELPPAYYEHLHNVYIHYAAERGIPAMLMLVWLLAKVLWDHRRALRQLPRGPGDERFLLHGVIAATLGVAVVSCFDLTLGDSEILGVYLATIAIGYKAVEAARRRPVAA
jgi:O-antigen ligase